MLLAIDPSVRCVGCALFEDERLVRAWFVKPVVIRAEEPAARWRRIAYIVREQANTSFVRTLVSERPQIYQREAGKTKGDPNELLGMVGVIGALAAIYWDCKVVTYVPHEWKGQVDKATMCRRILEKLTPDEKREVPLKSHDAIDAVGVGLHHLGRLGRTRVFSGAT